MPTAWRHGPYRFFFWSGDRSEFPHIHVERDDCVGKFWLDPVIAQDPGRFSEKEMNRIHKLVSANESHLLKKWDEFFYGE